MLIHMWTSRIVRPYDLYPSGIRKILKCAPDIPIIMAHMGSFCMMKRPNENLENLPENVFIDTAMSAELEEAGEFEEIIRRFGTNRVLYGSDFPYGTQKAAIARIKDSSFTDSEKEDMLWRNAAKILKTVGEEGPEVILAGEKEDKAETVYEISDLAYHVLVLMVSAGITVEDVTRELEKRHVIDHKVKQERMQ